jgi:6-phosphogluconolactonase
MKTKTELLIYRDPSELAERGSVVVKDVLTNAIAARGRAAIALAGGSTPAGLYERLAVLSVDWPRVDVFFGDERAVPPDHPDSNYRMARERLLDRAKVPPQNVHRMRGEEADHERAARDYEQEVMSVVPRAGDVPRFDVILLGIGEDGHTASLFPGTKALDERVRLVVPVWSEAKQTWRLSFTFKLIDAAARVMFIVAGAAKAPVLCQIVSPEKRSFLPAARVAPVDGTITVLADKAALGMA